MNQSNPQPIHDDLKLVAPWRIRLFPNHEWALILVLLIDFAIQCNRQQLLNGGECI